MTSKRRAVAVWTALLSAPAGAGWGANEVYEHGRGAGRAEIRAERASRPLGECASGVYPAEVLRVIDGDTVRVRIEFPPMGVSMETAVRLTEIDAPERFTEPGKAATAFVNDWVDQNDHQIRVVIEGPDKYGDRWDGTVFPIDGSKSLSDSLREAGHEK